jgi:hypothetical protein
MIKGNSIMENGALGHDNESFIPPNIILKRRPLATLKFKEIKTMPKKMNSTQSE